MAKKVFKKITVATLPNGYSLDVDGEEFMYFNELDLLAGFLARVGSASAKDMEKNELLNALFNMMLGQKYQNDVDRLKQTVNRLEARYTDVTSKLGCELDKAKEANERHEKLMKRIADLTKLVDEMQQGYQEACKPYDEYNKRINTLESKTTKMESHFNVATTEATTLLKSIRAMYEDLEKLVNKISSRGDMMIGRMINQVNKNAANMAEQQSGDEGGSDAEFQPAEEAAGTTADGPAADAAGGVAGETAVVAETDGAGADGKPKRKGGRPKKNDGDKKPKAKPKAKGETPRQKRDREILEKMMKDNPNIK